MPDDAVDSLATSLALVLPEVPETLVPPPYRRRICRLAEALAPIHCAGFEVRLTGDHRPVDFAQRIVAIDGEPTRFAEHIEAGALSSAGPTWTSLAAFAREWARPASVVGDEVAGAWLEFDAGGARGGGTGDAGGEGPEAASDDDARRASRGIVGDDRRDGARPVPSPSLFVSLRTPVEPGEAQRLLRLLRSLLDSLAAAPPAPQLEAALVRCVDACPVGAGVTDIGLMLGRTLDGIRLAAAPFAARHIGEYLHRLAWPGTAADLEAVAAPARVCETVTVSFDVASASSTILPRIGVEYFPGPYVDQLPRWRDFLTALVANDLCTEVERRALLAWPGYTLPPVDGRGWPTALIAESLLRSPRDFSVLGRRLNHVKVGCTPGGAPEAKAYFGFGPLWLRPEATGGRGNGRETGRRTRAGRADPAPASADAASLRQGMRAAVGFLLKTQSADGCWSDFDTVMGGSDEWVTAYVATELAGTDDEEARGGAGAAWRWLLQRRGPQEGWGFNHGLPQDADATTWGLLLAHAVGAGHVPRARAAQAALARHVSADGGLASYLPETREDLAAALGDAPMAGLFAPHVCVTAAAVRVPGLRRTTARFLRRQQLADGRWLPYWWCDDEYATGLAGFGLGRDDGTAARQHRGARTRREHEAAARAAAWSSSRIRRDGSIVSRYSGEASPFATACGVLALLGAGLPEDLARQCRGAVLAATGWLLGARREDDSWAPSALMRVPVGAGSPSGDAVAAFVGVDSAAVFTTATVLRTLRLSRGLFG